MHSKWCGNESIFEHKHTVKCFFVVFKGCLDNAEIEYQIAILRKVQIRVEIFKTMQWFLPFTI